MHTNETLAPDSLRHDAGARLRHDADARLRHDNGPPALETKAARRSVVAPAVLRRRVDPVRAIAGEIKAQGAAIARLTRTVSASDAARRLAAAKAKAVHALRSTVGARDRLVRKGRADVLLEHKLGRINATIDGIERKELAQLRAENAQLKRVAARPPLTRSGGARGYSAKSQFFALHRKGVLNYLKTGETVFMGQSLRDLERKALHTETNPDGGYFVHPEHDTGPLERLLRDAVVMRQVATVRPIAGASLKKPVDTLGTAASWIGERQARPETETPSIVELDFPAFELYAKPKASQTMLEDGMLDIEAWLAESVSDAFAQSEEAAFVSGDGVNKPKGLLAYSTVANGSWAWGSVGYTLTGVNGGFAAAGASVNQGDKLWELIYSLKAGYRQNAKFMMNSATVGVCRTLKDGEGRWIWADARDGNPAMLCGFDTVIAEQMPAIASGSLSIAFGDFAKTYVIVDRIGMSVLRDPYSNKPWVEFYTRKRVGGGIQNFEATKLLKFSAS